MASTEDSLTITFDLLDVELLMKSLLVATWNLRDKKEAESAKRLFDQVTRAAGPQFFGAAHRAIETDGPRGTNPEDGR
jgi:hypothetical protein